MTRPSWIGQTLGGRYRIDDILGQGGMSAVYKAYDPNLKRVVAVKMIHSHLADDPKFVIRFEEEAAAVAQLRHPNIVQVFDFNHDGDLYYMVQEFVAGETLQERLRRLNRSNRRMPLNEAIGYIINICDAAGYAHQRGLVHRDIKPANVMIDIHNQAILMDFGIVKITGGEKHTATGAVVGTALYLPPELIRGEVPDPRSDQYSLAVTLFEAVNGKPPYEADSTMTLMMMHLNDPLPDLRQLRPDIPPGLAAVIEKALAKSREERYNTMADFANALRGVLASLSSVAPAATVADEPAPPAQRPTDGIQAAAALIPKTAAEIPPSGPAAALPVQPVPSPGRLEATVDEPIYSSAPRPTAMPHSQEPLPAAASASVAASQAQPAVPPAVAYPSAPVGAAPSRNNLMLWGGIAAAAVIILVVLGFALRGGGGSNNPPAVPAVTTAPAATQEAVAALPTAEPSATPTPTLTPTITPTSPPTATPTITQSPTPTIPAGVPFARINAITTNDGGTYVVEFETFEYTVAPGSPHVHFFFNTVPQDQAGVPADPNNWWMYDQPSPFTGYRTSHRPAAATQMCILVANPDHSVQVNTGNCITLPDVNAAVPVFDDPCLAGPGDAYPSLGQLGAGQVLLVTGISPDEAWWTTDNPGSPGQTCWLQRSRSDFSGDLSTLPLAEVPPPPEGSQAGMSVQINQITSDDQGRYVVDFSTSGFTPALPGSPHIHFFFDTFTADQVSGATGGNRLMWGEASPFTGYTQADRPEGASQLCALVADPNHNVIEGSGNCAALPDVNPPASFQATLDQARSWPLSFQESFDDDQNGWNTGPESPPDIGSIDRRIENGRYRWEVNDLQPIPWWAATDKVNALDFYLAATARQVSGPASGEYGLIFRKNANQDFLAYKISDDGRYALYLWQNSTWQPLIDWSETDAVLPGEDNRMEVVARNDTVYLVLNGEMIGQYSPAGLDAGQPGFIASTKAPGGAGLWEFDDLEVRTPYVY